MPLADLLQWVKTTHRTGTLYVMRDGQEWELTLEGGRVVGYDGPELRDNLGHIVVTSGMLTEEDLRVAYQHQRQTGGSLQRALLDIGMLRLDELRDALSELARESIYDLFIDLPGEFVFSQHGGGLDFSLDDSVERLPLDLDVNRLLMEGARRHDEWQQLRERFPNDDVEVEIVDARLPPLESLAVRERRILASLSAGQSITDICLELRAPIPSVIRALTELEKSGAVVIRQASAAEHSRREASRVHDLLRQGGIMRQSGQFDEAVALYEVAVRMSPDNQAARTALKETVEEQIRYLYTVLPPVKVPVVVADEARLSRLRLRPEERFLIERLAAKMDIGSLIMVSSMSERDTLKTLHKLLHGSLIALS